jgi:hypothetical protein
LSSSPNWVKGYVPSASEWNTTYAGKLDANDPILSGGPWLSLAVGGTVAGPLNITATGSVTSRSAQDRAADWVNVKDFGATGTNNVADQAVFQTVIDSMTSGIGVAFVPSGHYPNMASLTPSPRAMAWVYGPNMVFNNGADPPGSVMFGSYKGSTASPWFIGPWGFGFNPLTAADAGHTNITIIKDSDYVGNNGGNNSSVNIHAISRSGVTSTEDALIIFTETFGGAQLAGIQIKAQNSGDGSITGANLFGSQITVLDQTLRKSSIGGSQVVEELHLWASGPDDSKVRNGISMILNQGDNSPDGERSVNRAIAVTGTMANNSYWGAISCPFAFTATAFGTAEQRGDWVIYDRAYHTDSANVAFAAESATAHWNVSGIQASGATSMVLTNSIGSAGYAWIGGVVGGLGQIQAGTTVTTQTYDGAGHTTIGLSLPLTGTIGSGAGITITSPFTTGFHTSGNFATAAMQLQTQFGTEITVLNGIWAGAATGSGMGIGTFNADSAYYTDGTQVVAARDTGWAAMTGTPDKATAFATSTVTLAQLAGRVMSLQAALTTHGLIGT